jgi:hypothetical protein
MAFVTAKTNFVHGNLRVTKGQTFEVSDVLARDLQRASLVRPVLTSPKEPEGPFVKKADAGLVAPLFVLPADPASPETTANESENGEPQKRKRGRPRKSAE